jgi:hypothetical protein
MATVLPQQNRNAGTYRSAPQAGASLPSGIIRARGLLAAADLQDATLAVTMGVEANDTPGAAAGAAGWYVLSASDWHGGAPTHDGTFPPPTAEAPTDNLPPTVRGFMTINQRVSIGVDLTVS